MVSQTIRIGIVGAGGIVKERHIPGFEKCPNAEIAAVCNRTRESSKAFANTYGIARTYENWRDLIAADDLDCILIGTWPYMHHDISIAALEAGKHVFCQARMARTAAEARRMEEAWRRSGLTAMLCPPPIAMYAGNVIQRILDSGELGAILSAHVRHLDAGYLDAGAPMSWRLNRDYQGFNTLTLGMYAEVLHRWFGPTKTVFGSTVIRTPERINPETNRLQRVEIAEEVFAAAVTAGGVHIQYTLSALAAHGGDSTIEVFGSEGSMKYVLQREEVWFGKKNGPLELLPISETDYKPWTVEADLINAIRNGIPDPSPTFTEGVRYMEVTEAVYESARTGQRISFAWSA